MGDGGTDAGTYQALRRPRRRWIAPALAFAAGLLVGGTAVGLVAATGDEPDGSSSAPAAAPTAGSSPTPSTSGLAVTVVVPPACLEVAERAQVSTDLVREGLDAARRLDVARLQELLQQLQAQTPELTSLAQECRDAASRSLATPTPS